MKKKFERNDSIHGYNADITKRKKRKKKQKEELNERKHLLLRMITIRLTNSVGKIQEKSGETPAHTSVIFIL